MLCLSSQQSIFYADKLGWSNVIDIIRMRWLLTVEYIVLRRANRVHLSALTWFVAYFRLLFIWVSSRGIAWPMCTL
jgi:hypothetical protein